MALHHTLLRSAGHNVTASLWCTRSQLTNPSLFSLGSVLKAHLTFSSPCWGAGNKTEECTCLLGWPTSSLLLNYSRALKCSSVWQHATRVPLFAPHDSSLTELTFMHERVQVCAYSARVCARVCVYVLQNTNTRTCWCYLHRQHTKQNISPRFDTQGFELWTEEDFVGKTSKHYKTQTRRHTSSLMFWCTQRTNLFQTALSWIQHTCQDRSSILPQKRFITCNYTPLRPSYLSLLRVTRISTVRSSTLRCVCPWLPLTTRFPVREKQAML